nr:nonstructural protein 3 [Psittaciform chaphamaparvovirus 6]
MSTGGFSVLFWVKQDSPLIENIDPSRQHHVETQETVIRNLLQDACVLIGCRWSMECTILSMNNTLYGYGYNNRITVSERTIRNALGDLTEHVDFLRSTVNTTAEDLVRYKECRVKWRVPEQVSESTSGWVDVAQESTSSFRKRPRY